MTLTVDDALPRLLEWGLVEPRDIVDGGLTISALSRRNLNLRVRRPGQTGYLIKQPDPLRAGGRKTLAAEALFFTFCAGESGLGVLAPCLPVARLSVPEGPLLVVEWLEEAQSLWQAYRALPSEPALATARSLGRALGTLHCAFRLPGLASDSRLASLPARPASFLSSHRPHPSELRRLSAAQHRLYRLVQSESAMVAGLESSLAAWRTETLLHGDVRSANVLVAPDEPEGRVLLIDWEFVKRGDAAWDVGCALADLAHFWLKGMPHQLELDPAERAAAAQTPLNALRPAATALWQGYSSTSGLSSGATEALLDRAVLYSGARLIQAAWQHSSRSSRLPDLTLLLLQLASNLLADPKAAKERFYGLATVEREADPCDA